MTDYKDSKIRLINLTYKIRKYKIWYKFIRVMSPCNDWEKIVVN